MIGIRCWSLTRSHHNRRAASLLEITACIVAVAVGLWLGARYLGLDLHAAAYTALNETEVMDQLPEGWRLAPPPGMEPQTAEEEALALTAELEALRFKVAHLNEESAEDAPEIKIEAADLPPELLKRRQGTLAFWSQLGGIREEVDRLQSSADEALNQQNVYQVLEIRRQAYLYGAKAVKVAMSENVDPQALQFAEQLVGWYQHGADLYGEAMNVWQTQHMPPGGLSSDQLLEQVQQQHDNEALLLFQKSGRLCEVLFRRYQVAFPDIDDSTRPAVE
ncbi:hypothetical protein [Aeoliella sp.]|uniref:hypothetical protein n=1 Tax=Aeoliella sp. TaxID=2795800 RepID=UPI003CCB9835